MNNEGELPIYYPTYDDPDFYDKLINKKEFNIEEKFGYIEPHQELLKNYISTATPYDNILLYNALGTGKTFSSISIAEGLKEQVYKNGKKIVVITKNKNLQINFLQELLLSNEYLTDEEREIFNKKTGLAKEKLKRELKKTISNYYRFYTYGTLTNMILGQTDVRTGKRPENYVGKITNFNNTVIIIDEAHNVTGNDVYTAIKKVLDVSFNYRLVLLTGTPISDNIKEIFEISNLLNKEADLPTRQDLIKSGYIEKVESSEGLLKGNLYKLTEEGENIITNSLRGRVSYVPQNQKNFPERIDIGESLKPELKGSQKVIFCKMSKRQSEVYKLTLALDNFKEDIDIIENIEEDDKLLELGEQKGSSLFKNSSDASTFIYPDNSFGKKGFQKYFKTKDIENKDFILYNKDLQEHSSKIYNLLKNIKENDGLVFIYSNYVSYGGTSLLKIILDNNGYSKYGTAGNNEKYIALDNTLSYEQREKYRKIFNSEENKNGSRIKILIGSPLMAEGITLKNVRQIHLLEPFWNMTRIEQIIGRGIRNYSHVALPENERNVKIFKYVAIPDKNEESSIDRAKYLLSEEKDRQNKKVERLLKEYAIDCHFAEKLPEKFDYTSRCDYVKCKINCQGKLLKIKDDSTYKTFIDVFEKDKINYTMNQMEDLIKQNFVWSINDIRKTIDSRISYDVIAYVLYIYVKEKITLYDKYSRSGYIIFIKDEKENDYIMFVPSGVKENSTMFEKYMNFKRIDNNLTLEEFIKTSKVKFAEKIDEKEEEVKDKKVKKEKVEKVEKEKVELTEQQKERNEEIMKQSIIYGSNYDRLGKKDDKFRIVDKRTIEQETDDQRRQISGMVCSSYKKGELVELAKYLQIPDEKLKGKLDKDYLCSLIQKQLQKDNNYLF
jgi:hypothetical protein